MGIVLTNAHCCPHHPPIRYICRCCRWYCGCPLSLDLQSCFCYVKRKGHFNWKFTQSVCTYTTNYCRINRISCTVIGQEKLYLIKKQVKRIKWKNQLLVENALPWSSCSLNFPNKICLTIDSKGFIFLACIVLFYDFVLIINYVKITSMFNCDHILSSTTGKKHKLLYFTLKLKFNEFTFQFCPWLI